MAKAKVYTCLWYDGNALEAAKLYVSLIPNSKVHGVEDYASDTPLVVRFNLGGTEYMGLNGGPHFKFNEAASIVVNCETQEEIDRLWAALLEGGGAESQCGWLKDRFGLSWQIVPTIMEELMSKGDKDAGGRMMAAMMKMVKLDIAQLKAAYYGQ
ncbi:MAG: VOC family protein [Caulobacterales bacterium]